MPATPQPQGAGAITAPTGQVLLTFDFERKAPLQPRKASATSTLVEAITRWLEQPL